MGRFHPRALIDMVLTYPRFLGTIKPEMLGRSEAELAARLSALRVAWWPVQLASPVGKRIVVIAPHADDETIGAGGLLLQHRGTASVHIVNVFNGERGGRLARGPWEATQAYRDELIGIRQAELRSVARRLGAASVEHMNLPDGYARPMMQDAERLRSILDLLQPDVVLLPWFLDAQPDHRAANVLYAWGNGTRDCVVLAYEVWGLLQPNANLDITNELSEKLELLQLYHSQVGTVDYRNLCEGLARTRAFHGALRPDRGGAAEAFMSLPSRDYCDFVEQLYGADGTLTTSGARLLE